MDEKARSRPEVADFLKKWKKFKEEEKRMIEARNATEIKTSEYEVAHFRFVKMVVNPMEEAWGRLTDDEKERLLADLCGIHKDMPK